MDVRELFEKKDELLGKTVTLSGWVRNHRKQKEFGFIDFSDGTCFCFSMAKHRASSITNCKTIY